ncbi:MAG: restriction endonuclease subunit S [Vicinamibacteria bacterium]
MRATGWRDVRLADCVELLAGFSFKSELFTEEPTDVALVKGENVSQGSILWDISKRWPASDWEKLAKFQLLPGDVVVAMDRPWVPAGLKWSFIRTRDPKALLVQRCARLRSKNESLDQDFLRFVIGGPGFEGYVKPITTGVNVPHISGQQILNFEFALAPVQVQRRIADILSAYDELIENSQRRIRILETMARALYREWFVHFRFPGHENVQQVASVLGDIPKDWTPTPLRQLTSKIGSGATPRGGKDAYKAAGIALVRSLNIYDYSFEFDNLAFIDQRQASELDNVIVQKNDILLNITGASVARCALVPSYLLPARVNQHVAIIRADPNKVSPFYVLDAINSDNRKAQLLALAQGGATREALTKDTIGDFQIVLPPRPLMERYGAIAMNIHQQREVLLRQGQNLLRTRDLLLPRLMTGQVSLCTGGLRSSRS